MATVTTRQLAGLTRKPGRWLSERISHGHGTLAFRSLANGEIAVYYRYTDQGRRRSHPLGRYNQSGTKGLTLLEARQQGHALSKKHAAGIIAIREHVQAEKRERNAALRRATHGTFEQLLDSYVTALNADGKESSIQVRQLFHKWVKQLHPDLLPRRANEITADDIMSILVCAARTGIGRTVNKLRSYLLAAFNRAIKAKGNPFLAASIGTGYSLQINPVSATSREPKFERALDRVLSESELRRLMKALDEQPLAIASAVRLLLLLGGQRPTQLLRVLRSDVHLDAATIRLIDPKGRRSQPRVHVVPVPLSAIPILSHLLSLNSDDSRLLPIGIGLLQDAVAGISAGKYHLRDLRRTAETMMAGMGVHKDIRAQLQSHGLGGIQARHYDKHDYLDQMRNSLEAWSARLEDIAAGRRGESNVRALRNR